MKTRNDFVSNSSSSSFIVAGNKGTFVDKFKLTKQDFIDAFTDLVSPAKLKSAKYEIFKVYDKKDKNDLKFITSKNCDYLKHWHCGLLTRHPISGQVYRDEGLNYDKFEDAYAVLREMYSLEWAYDVNEKIHYSICYDAKSNMMKRKRVPKHVDRVIRELHDYYGVMSNRDVLDCEFSRFLFQFGDNEVWGLAGVGVPGKNEEPIPGNSKYSREYNKAIKSSIYETDLNTVERLAEILFNWFKDHGKLVGLADETYEDLLRCFIAFSVHEG